MLIPCTDIRPIEFLLQPPPLPPSTLTATSPQLTGLPYEKYRTALQKQLSGQTPLFDDVLGVTSQHARILQDEFNVMRGDDEQSRSVHSQLCARSLLIPNRTFVAQLSKHCRPDLDQFHARVLDALEDVANCIETDSGSSMTLSRLLHDTDFP